MKKYLYYYYNLLFFKYYKENKIPIFSLDYSRKIVSSYLATLWLKVATEYILQLHIKSLYSTYLNYNGIFTNGILQTPKHLRELSLYSYLHSRIWMGWYPTLQSNPISLLTILKLNPYKKDKKFTAFLNILLTYHWDNPDKSITKIKMDSMIKKS